jgi:hypothetical protein
MNHDDLQKTWQSQEPVRRITIDADVLLREVRQNHRQFRFGTFWCDVLDAIVFLILAPFMVLWVNYSIPFVTWPTYLFVATIGAAVAFPLIDRYCRKCKMPATSDTLLGWAQSSLADVEHRIWLYRNVFWWYLLLPIVGIAMFYARLGWEMCDCWEALCLLLVVCVVTAAIFYWVYRFHQRWADKIGQPRRQELKDLVDNLKSLERNGTIAYTGK